MDTRVTTSSDTDQETNPPEEGQAMTFFEHLDELRSRLFKAVLAVGLGMAIAVFFTNPVLNFIKDTYGDQLRVLDPTDSVVIFFRVALFLGAVIASPMITYQLFMFVLPGLTGKERRWVFLSLPATTFLFLVGVLFTWSFLIPAYIGFLEGFQADVFKVDWTADNYIGFITAVLFWHAAAFETPLIFFVLGRFGVVSARSMIGYWRHAIVASSVVAAFITPTVDPLTMVVITVILVGLYALSVVLVALTSGIRRRPASTVR
jgi:sec-independent protein translocase protein TatC